MKVLYYKFFCNVIIFIIMATLLSLGVSFVLDIESVTNSEISAIKKEINEIKSINPRFFHKRTNPIRKNSFHDDKNISSSYSIEKFGIFLFTFLVALMSMFGLANVFKIFEYKEKILNNIKEFDEKHRADELKGLLSYITSNKKDIEDMQNSTIQLARNLKKTKDSMENLFQSSNLFSTRVRYAAIQSMIRESDEFRLASYQDYFENILETEELVLKEMQEIVKRNQATTVSHESVSDIDLQNQNLLVNSIKEAIEKAKSSSRNINRHH